MFTWDQTFEFVTIEIPIKICKKTDLNVTIKPNSISVSINDNHLINGELEQKIYPNESFWTIDKDILTIELAKVNTKDFDGWWKRLLKHEELKPGETISRPISELSPEMQLNYRKMQSDYIEKYNIN